MADKKKPQLTADKKAELIAKVRDGLTPDLQPLFDAYSSGRNPQLSKKLQDNNTNWSEVLTKWQATKEKKGGKVRKVTNPKTLLAKIQEAIKENTFDSLKQATEYCQDLIRAIEEKQEEHKQAKIDANKALIEKLQAETKALEGEQAGE